MTSAVLVVALLPQAAIAADAVVSVADVRVAPLLETRWNQYGLDDGEPCYNYSTPENMPCGCVATAAAQIMRFHCFPTDPVEPATYACYMSTGRQRSPIERLDLTLQGGTYAWVDMPPVPSAGTTLIQRQAIGKLTSDVGIACRTVYGEASSSAQGHLVATALTERFGYGSAVAAAGDALAADFVRSVLVSNLDAGLPVFVALKGSSGGHAVVADGYGYSQGTFLAHFNLGRSGRGDGWYALPAVAEFDSIQTLVYNIAPSGAQPTTVIDGDVALSANVGVHLDVPILRARVPQAKVTAKGLPRGLRLVSGRITGVPTKAGVSVATLSVRNASDDFRSMSVTFDVQPLDAWAKGTFNGCVRGQAGEMRGSLALSVSAAGKLNGKFDTGGTNWTVTASSYAAYDAAAKVYVAEAVAGCALRGAKLRRSFRLEIGVTENGVGEVVSTAAEGDATLCAWQNLWSGSYRAIGKEVFRTGQRARRTYSFIGGEYGLSEGESLTLTVTSAGKVTAKGVFPRHVVKTDSRGRTTVRNDIHKPTCSTVVLPTSSAADGAEGFAGVVYVSFPPSERNGFAGYAAALPL